MTPYQTNGANLPEGTSQPGAVGAIQGNQSGAAAVKPGMDETAAWHLALWEIEMQNYLAEDE